MPQTRVGEQQLEKDVTGNSVVTKIVAGSGVSITETGADTGTGVVTINSSSSIEFPIVQDTLDGFDTKAVELCGGGAVGNNRGAGVSLFGNEHAVSPGRLLLEAGNVANGEIIFRTYGSEKWQIPRTTTSIIRYSQSSAHIQANTSSGSDTYRLSLSGGGDALTTRGAFIQLHGNNHARTGVMRFNAGNVVGGDIEFSTANYLKWTIPYVSTISELVFNTTSGRIRSNTTTGNDNGNLLLLAAGASDIARTGVINIFGANHATNAGQIDIATADIVTGSVNISTGNTRRRTYLSGGTIVDNPVKINIAAANESSITRYGVTRRIHNTVDPHVLYSKGLEFGAQLWKVQIVCVGFDNSGVNDVYYSADLVFKFRHWFGCLQQDPVVKLTEFYSSGFTTTRPHADIVGSTARLICNGMAGRHLTYTANIEVVECQPGNA